MYRSRGAAAQRRESRWLPLVTCLQLLGSCSTSPAGVVWRRLCDEGCNTSVYFSELKHSVFARDVSGLVAYCCVFELHLEESDAVLLPHFARKAPDRDVSKCALEIASCPASCLVPPDICCVKRCCCQLTSSCFSSCFPLSVYD